MHEDLLQNYYLKPSTFKTGNRHHPHSQPGGGTLQSKVINTITQDNIIEILFFYDHVFIIELSVFSFLKSMFFITHYSVKTKQ